MNAFSIIDDCLIEGEQLFKAHDFYARPFKGIKITMICVDHSLGRSMVKFLARLLR